MNNTTLLRLTGAGALLLASGLAYADPCKLTIEGSDSMRFNLHEMAVPKTCPEVEVTLRHSGQMPAKVMGHNWVLTRDSDVSGIVNAGLSAGATRGYLPVNDPRVIAATKVVGGGETSTVTFSTQSLQEGLRYAFFCTSPGHSTVMRGTFIFGGNSRLVRADAPPK
jgi:azurin